MNLSQLFRGQKQTIESFIEKHCVLLTFALCVFCSTFSFMRQESLDPGNLFFGTGLIWLMGFVALFLVNKFFSLKTYINVILYVIFCIFSWRWVVGLHNSEYRAIYLFITFLFILTIAFCTIVLMKKMSVKIAICFIFALGFAIRLTYVLVTSIYTRQHDFYGFGIDGHGGYINYFYLFNFKLPDFDPTVIDQFYHPPLHYFICALWWKIQVLMGIADSYAQENIQALTLFYSCVCMILTYKILRHFSVDGLPLILGCSIMAFHPTFIIFSGSINNDILSITFMFSALYLALKWSKSEKIYDIIFCGICIGLGMMSKLSAYMICLPIAVIFIAKFFKDLLYKNNNSNEEDNSESDKTRNTKKRVLIKYLIQFGLFLVFCAPLALFWSFRNAILYDVPLDFVQKLPEDSWQYVGNYSALQRIFTIKPREFWSSYSVYDQWLYRGNNLYNEYNPLVSLLKTAMFGEYINNTDYPSLTIFADVAFWSQVVIAVGAMASVIYLIVRMIITKKVYFSRISIVVLYLSMFIFYYYFCFTFPHHCSMNIRYVSPLILAGLVAISLSLKDISSDLSLGKVKLKKSILYSSSTVIFIFSLFSMICFVLIASATKV